METKVKRVQNENWRLRNAEGFLVHSDKIGNVLELYANGITAKDIAIITDVHYVTVCKWITRHWFGYRGYDAITISLQSKV